MSENLPSPHIPPLRDIDFSIIDSVVRDFNKMAADLKTNRRPTMAETLEFDLEANKIQERIDANFQALVRDYQPTLTAIGFKIVSLDGYAEVELDNGNYFIAYLDAASKNIEVLSNSQIDGLAVLAEIVVKRTQYYLREGDITGSVVETLHHARGIVDAYKAFEQHIPSIDHTLSLLDNYVLYAQKGCLSEYVMVEKLLLNKPFNPKEYKLRWHIDTTPEQLELQWDNVLSTLQTISQNHNAVRDIYPQAITTVKDAVAYGLKELQDMKSGKNPKYTAEYAQSMLPILQKVERRLQDF